MESWNKISLEEEYRKNPELTEEMMNDLKQWVESQPYLPQSLSDLDLVCHIQSCDYDVEHARRALDINYTIRTKAEFFKKRDPCSQEIEDSSHCLQLMLMKDVDDEGNHAILGRLADVDPSKYNYNNTIRDCVMLMDMLRLENGSTPGLVTVMDLTGFTVSHLIRVPLGSLRHFIKYLQEGTPTKLKSLHLVNTKGSIIDKVMMLIRPLMSEKMIRMMHLHQGYKTLYDHGIKPSKLPKEYEGTAGTYAQLTEDVHIRMKDYAEYFREEEDQRTDESKRPRTKYFGLF